MTPRQYEDEATSTMEEWRRNMATSPIKIKREDQASSTLPSYYPPPFAPNIYCKYTFDIVLRSTSD